MERTTMKRNLVLALLIAACCLVIGQARAEQLVDMDTLAQWKAAGHDYVLIDVRPASLFERQHLPEAINIPLNVLQHNSLPPDVDIVFCDNDLSGLSSRRAIEASSDIDPSRLFVLRGGLQKAKLNRDVPLVQQTGVVEDTGADPITAEDLREAILTGMPVQIVDIRDAKSFKTDSVSRSRNVPLLLNPEKSSQIGTDTIWAHVALPKEAGQRAAESLKSDKQAVEDAMAGEIVRSLSIDRAARAQVPVVIVDDGSGIGGQLCTRLQRQGFAQARPLERGIISWRLLPNSMNKPVPQKETIVHGSTMIDREELRREHEAATTKE
ncbi:hypothetical protein KQI84_07780 [bacterium]|nr:hypothetical protein [bacterium]